MLVYSKKIIKFISEIKSIIKDILSREVGLTVFGDRFYDKREEYSYPIKVVIYNNQARLGYFDPLFYEIGFHERLMHSNREQLQNIIRHELAHYITFTNHGDWVKSHGDEFKSFCKQMGWGEEVHQATTCLDDGLDLQNDVGSNLLRKVQKLMALTNSSNTYEAEQAMIKSQQLQLKHNIDISNFEEDENDKIFLKRIMKQTKKNAKMSSIAQILETFFVNIVYNRKEGFTCLEVVGSATNVEIAEYVADILQQKLDHLWKQTKKQQPGLKGAIAKNSFFLGIAKGYCAKIQFLKKEYDSHTSKALVLIEKKLQDARSLVYQRLTKINSSAHYCSKSALLGEQAGKELTINPSVTNSNFSGTYLTFQT